MTSRFTSEMASAEAAMESGSARRQALQLLDTQKLGTQQLGVVVVRRDWPIPSCAPPALLHLASRPYVRKRTDSAPLSA